MTEPALQSYDIELTKTNIELLQTILRNWDKIKLLKEEADFWVHSVAIWDIPEDSRDFSVGRLCNTNNEDLDGCSLYSGDTQAEHGDMKDLLCQIFHGKDSADKRYSEHTEKE
jgi:hypothetical protein